MLPELFGHERHVGMKHAKSLVKDPDRARNDGAPDLRTLVAGEARLDDLDIPIAEVMP